MPDPTDTVSRRLRGLDSQIAESEVQLFDAVIIHRDEAMIEEIGKLIHFLRVERIKHQHALSNLIGYQNGT